MGRGADEDVLLVERKEGKAPTEAKAKRSLTTDNRKAIQAIYDLLLEDYYPGDHADFVDAYLDSDNPYLRAEGLFRQKHGIEVMLEESGEEVPQNIALAIDALRKQLQSLDLPVEDSTPLQLFQLQRFLDAFKKEENSFSGKKLREGKDPLEIMQKTLTKDRFPELQDLTLYLEGAAAGELLPAYRKIDAQLSASEDKAREGATLLGRPPRGNVILSPGSHWKKANQSTSYIVNNAVMTLSFGGQSQDSFGSDIASLSLYEIREEILQRLYPDQDIYQDNGLLRDDLEIPEAMIEDEVFHIAQHELIHNAQIPVSREDGFDDKAPEEKAFLMSFTEALTESYNLFLIHNGSWEGENGSYLSDRRSLAAVFRAAGIRREEEKELLEKLNHMRREEGVKLLDALLRENNAPSLRDIWQKEAGELHFVEE